MTATHRAWFGTLVSNGIVVLLGIATGVLTARLLLPEGRGELAVILFWPLLFQGLGMLGLKEAITHRISAAVVDIHAVVASGLWLAVVYAILMYIIGYFALPFLLNDGQQYLLDITRKFMLIFLPFGFIALSLRSVDQGRMKFAWHNALVVSVPATYLLGLLILWFLDAFSVANVVWVNLASIVGVAVLRLLLGWRWLLRLPSMTDSWHLFVRGIRFHLTSMVMLIGSQADRLVLVKLWDNASIGLYAVALTVASAGMGALANSFQTIVFPRMGRLTDKRAQHAYLAKQLRYAMVLLTGLALLIIGFSPWMIPLVFGEEFQSAIPTSIVLTLALIPYALRQILIAALRGLGESVPGTVSEVIALAGFGSLVWPLGTAIGLPGVAAAMLAGNLVAVAYLFRYLSRSLQLNTKDWWGLNIDTAAQLFKIGRHYVFGR